MLCPTCNWKLANNAQVCPSCQHDFVADRRKQALFAGVVALLLIAAISFIGFVLLLPGIIINTIRGRYKNRTRGLLSSALRDWQTWLISLPFAVPVVLIAVHVAGQAIKEQQMADLRTAQTHSAGAIADVQPGNASVDSTSLPPDTELASPQKLYSVVGVARGDTLNVHTGPAASKAVIAKLPNGYGSIRIIGPSVMNDTTEWSHITFENKSGWVNKHYLEVE